MKTDENSKMKVVHVFWSLNFGGIETMLVNIANAQVEYGACVYLVSINDNYDDTLIGALNRNVHVVLLHRRLHSKGFDFVIKLNKCLRQITPDVLHLHDPHLFGLLFSKRLRQISCATLHDVPYGVLCGKGLIKKLIPALNFRVQGNVAYLDKIPQVFSISNTVREQLLDKYGVDSIVVNNGILTSKFMQRQSGQMHSPMRIVQVSRLDYEKKGQDLLIESAAKLKGKIEVDFIGDGESLDYLKDLTRRLEVEQYVHFLGKKPQSFISNHLCDYDLFVQPSRYEGFGLTVAEAMAAQLPVLSTEGQGPAEVTCGEEYGWTFKNDNVDDLVSKITYIHNHYDEATAKATMARSYVIDTYDVSVTAKTYLEEYRRLCNKDL